MFDDLAAYYHENVITEFVTYWDTSKDGVAGRSRDLRQALVAATALFHMREHLPTSGALTRLETEQKCPDYALLGDVVNAAKHKSINQKTPHGDPLVTKAMSLIERKVLIEYSDAIGTYRHVLKTVTVKLADGSERNLLEVLTNVVNFWEIHLCALGILASARAFTFEEPGRHRIRAECNSGRIDLEIVQGQRVLQNVQLLRFNEATGKIEPVDLTGATVHASIYKPSYEFEVSLLHDVTGKEYKKIVALTDEESLALHLLQTAEERESFGFKTATAQSALHDLAVEAGLKPKDTNS